MKHRPAATAPIRGLMPLFLAAVVPGVSMRSECRASPPTQRNLRPVIGVFSQQQSRE